MRQRGLSLGRQLGGRTGGVRSVGGFCKRGARGMCIVVGVFANDIRFHDDRVSRTVELVVMGQRPHLYKGSMSCAQPNVRDKYARIVDSTHRELSQERK